MSIHLTSDKWALESSNTPQPPAPNLVAQTLAAAADALMNLPAEDFSKGLKSYLE